MSPAGKLPAVVTQAKVHIAARTAPGAHATIGGVICPVYSTGIFVRDGVPLQPGMNAIKIAVDHAGKHAETTFEVRRDPPPPPAVTPRAPIVIDHASVRPDKDVALLPGDELEVSFRGSPGRLAEYRVGPGPWTRMHETDGRYRASLVTTHVAELANVPVELRLAPEKPGEAVVPVTVQAQGKLQLWSPAIVRQAVVARDIGTDLVWGLHEVRLGGPPVGRMPEKTILRVTGMRGNSYRVRLTPQLEAWAEAEHVKMLPAGLPVLKQVFTNLRVRGDIGGDRVEIPWDAKVPFAVTPNLRTPGRSSIDVDLYGAHHGTTWVVHRSGLASISEVTVEQVATDHVRVHVELSARLWGWKVDTASGALVLTVRGAPHILDAAQPLKNFPVCIEAGHGGSNEGAAGLTRIHEKDVTLKIADLLAAELKQAGAKVSKVRVNDEFISMEDRAKRALKTDAAMFVSIHCNSADTDAGFLKVGGTSTFYKHQTGRDLARAILARLLAETTFPDYGSIGNFNYYPIRGVSWMPSVLVETAFLSNPHEEALLLDPDFQRVIALAIRHGIEDYLKGIATTH